MEIAEPCCGVRYIKCLGVVEEELTLTPHHTPSQSFDFIVWDKAYLDSIPAAAASNICTSISANTSKEEAPTLKGNFPKALITSPLYNTSPSKATPILQYPPASNYFGSSICVDEPSSDDHLKIYLDKETWVPIVHNTSSQNHSTLMSCRTDVDLPSCFFDYKPRTSDGALTNLEEAVLCYAERHPLQVVAAPSPSRRSKEPRTSCPATDDKLKQLNGNHEASLLRSFSQPGGGSSHGLFRPRDSHDAAVGFNKPTSKNGRAVFNHPGIYHDQHIAGPVLAQNRAKMSCFPTSPGRRKHGQSTRDDHEFPQLTGIFKRTSLDPHQQQEKLVSPASNPASNIHLQQQNMFICPMTTWADVMYMPAAADGGRPTPSFPMPLQDTDYRSSFSDMSSLGSNYDHHAATTLNMSKLKLWGLHHRFKALCKKLCYPF